MSWFEFVDWLHYAQVWPIGEVRGDLRMAMLSATIVNTVSSAVGGKARAKVEDFLPRFGERVRQTKDPAASWAKFTASIDAWGEAVKQQGGG